MKEHFARKVTLAGLLVAVAVVGSTFSFPVFSSKCAPVQHMVNILCAVLLGPGYGVAAAFAASLLRNLLGLGSLLAFPGSMCGVYGCGSRQYRLLCLRGPLPGVHGRRVHSGRHPGILPGAQRRHEIHAVGHLTPASRRNFHHA